MNILAEVSAILGPPVAVHHHRGWADWWCPFHQDRDRAGRGGRPNFGVNLVDGYWRCFRCGASGASVDQLRKKLGADWKPKEFKSVSREENLVTVSSISEGIDAARAVLLQKAAGYLRQRGLRPYTAMLYGLGYGVPRPPVTPQVWAAARELRLINGHDWWLWAGGIVYADPPSSPTIIQVRHLREGAPKYQSWGRLGNPLGAWRITPQTRVVVVVEGMFDMLVIAQALYDHRLENVIPVYTSSAAVSHTMRVWFEKKRDVEYILIPDPDEAGRDWEKSLMAAIRKSGSPVRIERPPEGLDPDEAVLQGWWPTCL
ncbi:MAG: hypothetical protein HPY45_09900 [Anaerolineae bacterium]|nr:hypothetical protein [Anaerolineae bacterium]